MEMIKLLSLLVVTAFSLTQCNDPEPTTQDDCPNAEAYIIKDFTGLDGCTWMLVQGDKSYEPLNLPDFITTPVAEQEVMLEVVERPDFGSVCQVGPIVEITCQK